MSGLVPRSAVGRGKAASPEALVTMAAAYEPWEMGFSLQLLNMLMQVSDWYLIDPLFAVTLYMSCTIWTQCFSKCGGTGWQPCAVCQA
jgi:hypothetical protein